MGLLYLEEHLRCINYDHDKNPAIEFVSIEEGESWENLSLGNKLIFLLDGRLVFSFGEYSDCQIRCKQIVYLPTGYKFTCKALEKSIFFVICIQGHTCFCDNYHFKDLEKEVIYKIKYPASTGNSLFTLEMNEYLEKYLNNLLDYVHVGVKCRSFYQLKIKELFYIFRWFYPKNVLWEFFQYDLKSGNEFAASIMDTWYKYKSVGEFANAMNYTTSGFEKRFKRIFGLSPYKWMKDQKAKRIFHQIRNTNQPFKQISSDFGFSSLPSFNDFCKANFGKPPGNIREK
ncbi:MAG: AraC family transcriptional regulator [Prevotella sp.]|jgi:AraC-like DNA-binding protein|nr:AraC family transcriptional regulator [Prevotella sp.]